MLDIVRNSMEDMPDEDCAALCVRGSKLRKLTIKPPPVRVQLVYKTFREREVEEKKEGGGGVYTGGGDEDNLC